MESDDSERIPSRSAPSPKKKLKSPVAREVEKVRSNGHRDKVIIDKLIEPDGFTINNTETTSKSFVKPTFRSASNVPINQVHSLKIPPRSRKKRQKSSQQVNSDNSDVENLVDLNKTSNKQINQQIVI